MVSFASRAFSPLTYLCKCTYTHTWYVTARVSQSPWSSLWITGDKPLTWAGEMLSTWEQVLLLQRTQVCFSEVRWLTAACISSSKRSVDAFRPQWVPALRCMDPHTDVHIIKNKMNLGGKKYSNQPEAEVWETPPANHPTSAKTWRTSRSSRARLGEQHLVSSFHGSRSKNFLFLSNDFKWEKFPALWKTCFSH